MEMKNCLVFNKKPFTIRCNIHCQSISDRVSCLTPETSETESEAVDRSKSQ